MECFQKFSFQSRNPCILLLFLCIFRLVEFFIFPFLIGCLFQVLLQWFSIFIRCSPALFDSYHSDQISYLKARRMFQKFSSLFSQTVQSWNPCLHFFHRIWSWFHSASSWLNLRIDRCLGIRRQHWKKKGNHFPKLRNCRTIWFEPEDFYWLTSR